MLAQKFSCCAWVPMLKLSVTPREGKKQAPSAQQNSDSESVQLKSPLGSGIGSYVGWALSFILLPALGVFTDHFGAWGRAVLCAEYALRRGNAVEATTD